MLPDQQSSVIPVDMGADTSDRLRLFRKLVAEQVCNPLQLTPPQVRGAVKLIAEAGQNRGGGGSSWYRHLQSHKNRHLVRDLLRKNPALRRGLAAEAKKDAEVEAALQAFKHFDIGVAVARRSLSSATIAAALEASEGLGISPLLATVIDQNALPTLQGQALIKQAHPIALAKEDNALSALGVTLVAEVGPILKRVQGSRALRALLAAVLLEEPLVSAGIREQIARTGFPPDLHELTNALGLVREAGTGHHVEPLKREIVPSNMALLA